MSKSRPGEATGLLCIPNCNHGNAMHGSMVAEPPQEPTPGRVMKSKHLFAGKRERHFSAHPSPSFLKASSFRTDGTEYIIVNNPIKALHLPISTTQFFL